MARTRILVIEDERGLTDPLVYNLQREGYEAIVAHDGQEGLRKAQTLLPDLIEDLREHPFPHGPARAGGCWMVDVGCASRSDP